MASVSGSDERLSRVTAVATGKGGCGKTSITANLAGQSARAGYPTLVIDLDRQGNLGRDLGYTQRKLTDNGAGLVEALWRDLPLPVLEGVRDNLDVIPGGPDLDLLDALDGRGDRPPLGVVFAEKLAELVDANEYDLVLLDCPPGNPLVQQMALTAARHVLIPTKTDPGSWDGIVWLAQQVGKVREVNPLINYLGVVIFSCNASATAVLRATRTELGHALAQAKNASDALEIFDPFVRTSESSAASCRKRGQLAHELAADADTTSRDRLRALRRRSNGEAVDIPAALSATAGSLAQDYEDLAVEVFQRIVAAEGSATVSAGM